MKLGCDLQQIPLHPPCIDRVTARGPRDGGRKRGGTPAFCRSRPPRLAPSRLRSVYGLMSGIFPPNRLPVLASTVASWFSSTHLPLRGQRRSWLIKNRTGLPVSPIGPRTDGRLNAPTSLTRIIPGFKSHA